MKNIFLFIALVITGVSYGQIMSNDLAMIQSSFGKEKKLLVSDYMELNPTDATAFWAVYESYEKERQALVATYITDIWTYANKYDVMNNEAAAKVMNLSFSKEKEYTSLKKNYFKKIDKAVGGLTAAKFFQLENYLHNFILSQIQEQIPNIGDLQ